MIGRCSKYEYQSNMVNHAHFQILPAKIRGEQAQAQDARRADA
jgi:hypothetical protein